MAARTLEQIEAEIAETKAALQDVHGDRTEVYARIVGYYRAVTNWNKGKRDEFDQRKLFELDGEDLSQKEEPGAQDTGATPVKADSPAIGEHVRATQRPSAQGARYELFVRPSCPNCPPVKKYLSGIPMQGTTVDCSTDEGLNEAATKGVFATPTVILYGADGNERARAHSVSELSDILSTEAVAATA
ncbi:MAG: hypothetical protein J1D88_03375 [Treponema sp.]|nr:hypothetical protein [Treponema sp.]